MNYMDADKRLLNDFWNSKIPVEDLMRKYRMSEDEVLAIIDGAPSSKAVKALEVVLDMYYGNVRSDAVKKFKELL